MDYIALNQAINGSNGGGLASIASTVLRNNSLERMQERDISLRHAIAGKDDDYRHAIAEKDDRYRHTALQTEDAFKREELDTNSALKRELMESDERIAKINNAARLMDAQTRAGKQDFDQTQGLKTEKATEIKNVQERLARVASKYIDPQTGQLDAAKFKTDPLSRPLLSQAQNLMTGAQALERVPGGQFTFAQTQTDQDVVGLTDQDGKQYPLTPGGTKYASGDSHYRADLMDVFNNFTAYASRYQAATQLESMTDFIQATDLADQEATQNSVNALSVYGAKPNHQATLTRARGAVAAERVVGPGAGAEMARGNAVTAEEKLDVENQREITQHEATKNADARLADVQADEQIAAYRQEKADSLRRNAIAKKLAEVRNRDKRWFDGLLDLFKEDQVLEDFSEEDLTAQIDILLRSPKNAKAFQTRFGWKNSRPTTEDEMATFLDYLESHPQVLESVKQRPQEKANGTSYHRATTSTPLTVRG